MTRVSAWGRGLVRKTFGWVRGLEESSTALQTSHCVAAIPQSALRAASSLYTREPFWCAVPQEVRSKLATRPLSHRFALTAPLLRGAKGSEPFGAYVATYSLPTTPSPKSPGQCVSYSAAASGLLTSLQGTDARANLSGSWYSVRL